MTARKVTPFGVVVMLFALLAPRLSTAQDAAVRKQELIELALQHSSAEQLYQTLREEAGGGQPLTWRNMPDWSGLWRRYSPTGNVFDPGRPEGTLTTAKLTPEAYSRLEDKVNLASGGNVYDDALSTCGPPGFPRWLAVPFLREFIVRPEQTWLSSETVNHVRRIYTDGLDHMPELDQYPLYYGDSIGFWDGHKLVIHTNQLMNSSYGRAHPDHSEQAETVEIWEKLGDGSIRVDAWVYDPPILVEPWYNEFSYARQQNEDGRLRLRYWHCGENPNNDVFETSEGATQYSDFTFTSEDDR